MQMIDTDTIVNQVFNRRDNYFHIPHLKVITLQMWNYIVLYINIFIYDFKNQLGLI